MYRERKTERAVIDLNIGDHFGCGIENGSQVLRIERRRAVKT